MKNKIKCTCNLCRKGKYNSEDYCVDMSFLKKERPVGVSGLLRVKNDMSRIGGRRKEICLFFA
ncbi:hypothetical protein AALM74_25285 [Parabacteroides segnis]|uniref:hypothetical protein n=1 Tax=Parabacteroides segnis TaxID=2763058 RepID=UPI003517DC65